MPVPEARFPVLFGLLQNCPEEHMWKSLLTESQRHPEVTDNFSSTLLSIQEDIIGKLEDSNPTRWPRKRRTFLTTIHEPRQLDLRVEFLVMAKVLTLGFHAEFESEGTESSPDIQLHGFADQKSLFLEITARAEQDPKVLPEIREIFENRFSTGGLTETLEPYKRAINLHIKKKCEQSISHDWDENCLLLIDLSRYGIAWFRSVSSWEAVLHDLEIPWEQVPFLSISIIFSDLASTDIHVATRKNPRNSHHQNEKVDLISAVLRIRTF